MTTTVIIFWSIAIIVIISFVIYFKRQKSYEIERNERRKKIQEDISDLKKRYLNIKDKLRFYVKKDYFSHAETLLTIINTIDSYENLIYYLGCLKQEIIVFEKLYAGFQEEAANLKEKEDIKQKKLFEFVELYRQLEEKISLYEEGSLSIEERNLISSIKNRLMVDANRVNEHPKESVRRTRASLKKLASLSNVEVGPKSPQESNGAIFFMFT